MTSDGWATLSVVGKWLLAAMFIGVGVTHFTSPGAFLKIVPPYLPWHRALVLVSGAAEILLGVLLLVPATSSLAAWGLVALLIAVFPANIHLYMHQELMPLPPVVHLLRLPMQGVFILWAYAYAKR